MSINTHRIALLAHPSTRCEVVRGVEVRVCRVEPALFTFEYLLQADLSQLRIPAGGARGRADSLWKHTCFEAFLWPSGPDGYYELNFSPSGQWAAYSLDSYRQGLSPVGLADSPEILVHRSPEDLVLQATVGLAPSARLRAADPLRLALAAVIEEENGRLSYWAGRHPAGKPDFHHPDGFAFEL